MSRTRRFIAFSLALAVLNLSAGVALAALPGSGASLATLRVSGEVTVNELRALSGQTILPNSSIITASNSKSILELGNFTRLILSAQSELAVDFSAASIAGSLRRGELRAFMPAARGLNITTPHAVLATDARQPAVFTVQVHAGFTQISVETGRVELRVGKTSRVLGAGETFLTDCDSLAVPAPPHQNLDNAGKVGIIAGIGTGVAVLLTLLIGRDHEEELDFGGCVIILSPTNDPPGTCH
jgi:ferric-dicitrate binding protein FerR (iron transport regulator)